ncbi:hypothetical protein XM25_02525 [Devosia sp. H5989]|nr:hypothetical protein XM25_02525 [Devosia sp. H5989]
MEKITLTRRRLLAGSTCLGLAILARPAWAQTMLDGATLGVVPDLSEDQSQALQAALEAASAQNLPLFLPAGIYRAANLNVPDGMQVIGMPGETVLTLSHGQTILSVTGRTNVTLDGLAFDGGNGDGGEARTGLLDIQNSRGVTLSNARFVNAAGNGLAIFASEGLVENCTFESVSTALFALDNVGLVISSNRIRDCRNNGILVWRSASGRDGTIVTNNRISNVAFDAGGNGQNGNGINVFRADEVIVANNHIADCAFSAVRLNSTNNTQVTGNACINSSETAIFSEFAFSGSVIANNIIDTAAVGISIANLDSEGHLATCTGNIVRNITPNSATNPDTTPAGIFAEADVAIIGNVIDNVPGPGILAGWGPFLRNVLVNGNIVRNAEVGIAASVVEDAGSAQITNNTISGSRRAAIAGMAWQELRSEKLAEEASRFPNVTVSGNVTG